MEAHPPGVLSNVGWGTDPKVRAVHRFMARPLRPCPRPLPSQPFQEHLVFSLRLNSLLLPFRRQTPTHPSKPKSSRFSQSFPPRPSDKAKPPFSGRSLRAHPSTTDLSIACPAWPRHGPRARGGSQPPLPLLPHRQGVWHSVCPRSNEDGDGCCRSRVRAGRVAEAAASEASPVFLRQRPGLPSPGHTVR